MILPARANIEALIIDILARIAKTQPSWIEGMSPFQEEKMTKWLMMADHNKTKCTWQVGPILWT